MTPEQLKASILQYAIQGKLVEQRAEEGTGEELYQQIQAEKQHLIAEKKIKKEIKRIDKNRSRYYEFYTGKKWGDKLSYDLCVNTSSLNIKEIAKTIAKLFK